MTGRGTGTEINGLRSKVPIDATQGTLWRDRYLELREGNSYEMALLNAHGAPDLHYPCIGAAGRRFGLTVFGDSFLRLDE